MPIFMVVAMLASQTGALTIVHEDASEAAADVASAAAGLSDVQLAPASHSAACVRDPRCSDRPAGRVLFVATDADGGGLTLDVIDADGTLRAREHVGVAARELRRAALAAVLPRLLALPSSSPGPLPAQATTDPAGVPPALVVVLVGGGALCLVGVAAASIYAAIVGVTAASAAASAACGNAVQLGCIQPFAVITGAVGACGAALTGASDACTATVNDPCAALPPCTVAAAPVSEAWAPSDADARAPRPPPPAPAPMRF